jgi:hypothetical protein
MSYIEVYEKYITLEKAKIRAAEESLIDLKRKFKQIESEKDIAVKHDNNQNSVVMDEMYPRKGEFLEVFQYIEDLTGRVWNQKQVIELAEKNGDRKKTKESLRHAIVLCLKRGYLISLKYNNSRKYTFYTTRKEWVDIENKRLLPDHEPEPEIIKSLNDEQKKNLTWIGI